MRRIALVLVAVIAALVPAPAHAGGSVIEPGLRGYGVGDTAAFEGSFSLSGSLSGTLSDGPYLAYLLPVGSYRVDDPAAVAVGKITMRRTVGSLVDASITFTVPAVSTGQYHLAYCNDPCTVDGIGDLIGSRAFFVAPTRPEALLRSRIEHLSWRLADARRNGRREADRLERALEGRSAELAAAEAELRALRGAPVPRIVEERAAASSVVAPESSVTWWIALLAAALGIAAGTAVGRRRSRRELAVPDWVPDDLAEREPSIPR